MGMKISTATHFPVPVDIDAQDMRGSFVAYVERLDDVRLAGIVDGMRDLVDRGATTQQLFEYRRETLRQHLDRVEGLTDDSGKMDPKGAALEFVISNPACALETFEALLSGQTSAAVKNSKPSRSR